MKILVLGNGFDLAHGLPTKYADFLNFWKDVRRIYTFDSGMPDWHTTNPTVKEMLTTAFSKRKRKNEDGTWEWYLPEDDMLKHFVDVYNCLDGNIWMDYFEKKDNENSISGKNWIDFESEISCVIQSVDAKAHTNSINDTALSTHIHNTLQMSRQNKQVYSKEEWAEHLYKHLQNLIRGLEIYLSAFVSKISIGKKIREIENLHPDCVLSFNYTDTYRRQYGKRSESEPPIKYDYIHGKASADRPAESCNMTLGIGEYLDENEKDRNVDFIAFKKYFQRIVKSTGSEYCNWLNSTCEVYFYGHSLDITDKDILLRFLDVREWTVSLFYRRENEYDTRSLGKLVRKLVLLIGQDELIHRTSGEHPTIQFLPIDS